MDYSQDEINNILLGKKLNECYFAIIERRESLLTDEEYTEIKKRERVIDGEDNDEFERILSDIDKDECSSTIKDVKMQVLFSIARMRYLAILTIIDGKVYDILNCNFIDLKRYKIIHFDNLINYYNEKNARIRLFTPEEEPKLPQILALLDVDDEACVHIYESDHIKQKASHDLTNAFMEETKGISRRRNKM